MTKVPSDYLIDGLEAIHYSKPDDRSEAVKYKTPNGTDFVIARDMMGVQICKGGVFWPPPFTSFRTMIEAIELLKINVSNAITYFDKVKIALDRRRKEMV